jgi:IS30 family transposase
MNQDTQKARTYQHLSLMERESFALKMESKKSTKAITNELDHHTSTITREIKGNSSPVNN